MTETKKTILFDINKILNKINISEKQKVADLGCGNFGFFVFPLASLVGKEGKVYAVDILKEVLKEIKEKAENLNLTQIKTVWSDLEVFNATEIESSSVDAVTLVNVLNQINNKLTTLQEASRMLKTGGKMLIIEWKNTNNPLSSAIKKKVEISELKESASSLNLKIVEEFEVGPYNYAIIFKKI